MSDAEFSKSPWAPGWWEEWQKSMMGDPGHRSSSSNLPPPPRFASRAAAFACAAAAEALADAGIDFRSKEGGGSEDGTAICRSRVAVSIGIGMPAVRAAALAGGELFARGRGIKGGGGGGGTGEQHNGLPLLSAPTSRLLRDAALASGPSTLLATSLGLHGPLFAPSTACAAGASAVADAFEAVASGAADVALAGGSEACVDAVTLAAFSRMRALCADSNGDGDDGRDGSSAPWGASRPFGEGRSGFVVGEGAGVLVLEAAETAAARRRRKAKAQHPVAGTGAYCELRGCGASADAHALNEARCIACSQRRAHFGGLVFFAPAPCSQM